MTKIYHCTFAERRPDKILIQCKATGESCAFQRYCPNKFKTILTEGSEGCLRANANPSSVTS